MRNSQREEARVRRGPTFAGIILVLWLIIGAIAAGQRGYFDGSETNCAEAGSIAVTVIAGPLNYIGLNPKINCDLPQPSQ
jgi:hypothetical protein